MASASLLHRSEITAKQTWTECHGEAFGIFQQNYGA